MVPNKRTLRRHLAKSLRALRENRDWSQEKLAEESGLHRTYVSLIERGQCNVGLDNLEGLANTFGVSVADLFNAGQMNQRESEKRPHAAEQTTTNSTIRQRRDEVA